MVKMRPEHAWRFSGLGVLLAFLLWLGVGAGLMAHAEEPAQAAAAEARPTDLQQEVVAKVGERTITLAEFNQMLPRDPQNPGAKMSPEQKKAHLERVVNALLFLEEAKQLRLRERPEVAAKIDEATSKVLIGEYLRLSITEKAKVEESEVKAYWESHPEEFTAPPQVRARHILIGISGSGVEEGEALKKAEAILARIRAGEDFGKLASELSEDPGTKARGGDLGAFGPGKMVPAFDKAAFALKPGEVSGPVRTSFGYHIIKVEDRQEPFRRPFESVRQMIHSRLARERQRDQLQALLKELKGRIKTEVHPNIFDAEE